VGRRNAALGPAQKEMRSASGAALLVLNHVRTQSEAARQNPPLGRISLGPGRFGLSREKEAAGAAR